MYDELFGLTGRPFQLTPDPAFWYETATHRRAMAYLGYGLAQGEGFIVITGDIGAGKTTLVGHLLDTLDREALNPIKLVSTAIEASDLLRIVATELGVNPAGLEKAQLLTAIERGLHAIARTGRRTLLIVDEAQALSVGALEELRMLSNFQAGGHALLQIVLLGQPEFRAALHGSERLEQLRQRVIAIHHLEPMAAGEVAAYVRHRLSIVGWQERPGFADSAFAALHRYSDGVPRRLNQLANRVMLHAAVEGVATITAATVDHVAADLFADLPTMGAPAGDLPAPPPVAPPEPVRSVEAMPAAPTPPVEVAPVEVPPFRGASIEPAPVESAPVESAPVESAPVEPAPIEPAPIVAGAAAVADPVEPAPEPVAEAKPRPFRHSWLETATVPAEPIRFVAAPVPPAPPAERARAMVATADNDEAPVAAGVADEVRQTLPKSPPVPAPTPAAPDPAFADRFAELEARLEEQDAALRRVLTLLVDWVETDQSPRPALAPAPVDEPRGYVPIRGAAA